MKKTIRINLVAPPSRGKTSISYLVGAYLKLNDSINVEVISEVAKEKVFQGINLDEESHEDTILEFHEQARRENIYHSKVDCIITSSPLMVKLLYCQEKEDLKNIVLENEKKWTKDLYFFLTEDQNLDFEQEGRDLWSEESSREFEPVLKDFFNKQNIELIELSGNPEERTQNIINRIKEELRNINKKEMLLY